MPVSFTYPGITDIESAAINYTHGITPSEAVVVAPLQSLTGIQNGTMVVAYSGSVIVWQDCAIPEYSLSVLDGHLVQLTIQDRRWKWKYGAIFGWWNRRKGDTEDLVASTEKTPRELLTLLLAALGETGYNLSRVPNDARPEVKWEGTTPAQEMQKLCDDLGLRIILRYDNTVSFIPIGSGSLLPALTSSLISPSASFANLDRPDNVEVYSAPYEIDSRFTLEPRAEESDGTYVALGSCSYLPAEGYFDVSMGNVADDDEAILARRSVYRVYEITGVVRSDSFPHTTLADFEFQDQQLLLHPTKDKRIPARCYGRFTNEEAINGTDFEGWWEDDVQIDGPRRLVTFNRPCYRIVNNKPAAATMYLQTAVTVRTTTNHGYERWSVTTAIPGIPRRTQAAVTVRDDIRYTRRDTFTGLTTYVSATESVTDTAAQLTEIADAEVLRWTPQTGGQGVYNGIHTFDLDGYRDRVSWSWSTRQAPQTVLAAATELNPYSPNEEARRKNRALDRMLRRATVQEFVERVRE